MAEDRFIWTDDQPGVKITVPETPEDPEIDGPFDPVLAAIEDDGKSSDPRIPKFLQVTDPDPFIPAFLRGKGFDPSEQPDEGGRWTSGGGGQSGGERNLSKRELAKKHFNPATVDKQRIADKSEQDLSAGLG